MFGKPAWFGEKLLGWGLHPISWQGWVYSAVWTAVIVAPSLLLLASRGPAEALVWMGASAVALTWDVRKVRQAIKAANEPDVFVIDENTDASHLATRQFDMELRD